MVRFFSEVILGPLQRFFGNAFSQINEINKKYATPHIKTSKAVKFALLMLRFYLVLLVGILFFKFYATVVK